jgi:hypothetical protein
VRLPELLQDAAPGGIRKRRKRRVESGSQILYHMVQYVLRMGGLQGGAEGDALKIPFESLVSPPRGFSRMPRYEVTVQGRGIVVPVQAALAVGFLRIVQVTAGNPVAAQERALDQVRSEWHRGSCASANRSGMLYLTVDTIGLLSWWHRLLGAPEGYMFFSAEGLQLPSDQRLRQR